MRYRYIYETGGTVEAENEEEAQAKAFAQMVEEEKAGHCAIVWPDPVDAPPPFDGTTRYTS